MACNNARRLICPALSPCVSLDSKWCSHTIVLTRIHFGDARGVTAIVVGNGLGETSLKSWKALIVIFRTPNTLGKGMNPIIRPPTMSKYLELSAVVWRSVEENSNFKPVELHLKIDLMSHPARTEERVNTGTLEK